METVTFVTVAGVAMPIVVELLKKLLPKVEVRYFTIGYCFLMALGYALITTLVPLEFVNLIALVGGTTFLTGSAIYKIQK